MIRHIVAWKLSAETEEGKTASFAAISEGLLSLPPLIPEIVSFEVHANGAYFDKNFDLVLLADYATYDDLEAYQVHPEHQRVVAIVREHVSARASIDFEV